MYTTDFYKITHKVKNTSYTLERVPHRTRKTIDLRIPHTRTALKMPAHIKPAYLFEFSIIGTIQLHWRIKQYKKIGQEHISVP